MSPLLSSYPAVWVVPERCTDESLIRVASHFQDNRLPVVTWKHPRTGAVLLCSSSFVVPPASKKKPLLPKPTDKPFDHDVVGIMNPDVEVYLSEIVKMSPSEDWEGGGKSLTLSLSREATMPLSSVVFMTELEDCPEDEVLNVQSPRTPPGVSGSADTCSSGGSPHSPGSRSQYHHSLYASTEVNFELFEGLPVFSHSLSFEEQPMTLASNVNMKDEPLSIEQLRSLSILSGREGREEEEEEEEGEERLHVGSASPNMPDLGMEQPNPLDFGEVYGKDIGREGHPHVTIASLPTNPRDWIVMNALPQEVDHWQANGLYVLGDKSVLRNVPCNLYPGCTLIPIEVRERKRAKLVLKMQKKKSWIANCFDHYRICHCHPLHGEGSVQLCLLNLALLYQTLPG